MPQISLVVCLYKERDLLERLLNHAEGCYDDLVVVHDGPEEGDPSWEPGPPRPELAIDWAQIPPGAPLPPVFAELQKPAAPGSMREFVESRGGRFYIHPRVGSLEGQSPFAWWAARHDWILRLDADEFPSEEMKAWLKEFRAAPEPDESVSGYTCVWPHWDGKKSLGTKWPDGRIFLFKRQRVKFVGLVELAPQPKGRYEALPLVLWHQPKRKSFGFRNIFFRQQSWVWRRVIARTLFERLPDQMPRWDWPAGAGWPAPFNSLVSEPWRHIFNSLVNSPRWCLRSTIKARLWTTLYCFYAVGWHHALVSFELIRIRSKAAR